MNNQSIEPQIADLVNGWLKSYGLNYFLEQESVNPEIENALAKAPSKSGGTGKNRVDCKLLLANEGLEYFPVMIEYKGYKDKLEKLNSEGQVANTKADGTPNYQNINSFAVNGAVHYANAILKYASFSNIIAIGVTGYKNPSGEITPQIGVYLVSKENYGVGQKVGDFTDLSFLKLENFSNFTNHLKTLKLSPKEIEKINKDRDQKIEDALSKINESLFNKQKNISALARIHFIAASIMANLGVANKVSPLTPEDLPSITEAGNTDSDIIIRKIKAFLKEKNIPSKKREQIIRSLTQTIDNENFYTPENGQSLIKEIFIEVIEDLSEFYKTGVNTDFTGKLFNVMFKWMSFVGDDQNDVVLTPRYVTFLMAKLANINKDSYVWDFATGSAGLLVAAMNLMLEDAKNTIASSDELAQKEHKIKSEQILGIEVSPEVYMLAVLNMILMGDGSSNIIEADSLRKFNGQYGYGREGENFPADAFLLNPPYSAEGNGMVFVEKAFQMMNKGYGVVIIQDSAGSGKAQAINQRILRQNTLVASLKMPADLFGGKSSVQTSIYVFEVNKPHHTKQLVRFIDFRNDGYKRSNRKKAKASANLRNEDRAIERYDEVVDLVKFGKTYLNIFSEKEFVEDIICVETGHKDFGADWNFDQHKKIDTTPKIDDFKKTVGDYLAWEVSQILKNGTPIELDNSKFEKADADFLAQGGEFREFEIQELFEIKPTKNYGLTNEKLFETKGTTPVVVNSSLNNGIGGFVDLEPTEKGNIITFSDTTTSDAIFYQPKDFIGYSHVQGVYPLEKEKWSSYSLRYFCSTFRKSTFGLFSYGNKFNREKARKVKIQLPVEKSGEIAFKFMEERIKELELERIKELEAYLTATGLRNAQITPAEARILAEFNDLIENESHRESTHTHTHTD